MLDIMFRIIIASSLLAGSAVFTSPVHAGVAGRTLPCAMHPAKVDPCKASWPNLIRTCLA